MAFALALWLVRATVDDVSCMKAMIPHHSVAILTSERLTLQVDDKKAAATASHGGKTFYFCSASCKASFEKDA